MDNKEIRWRQRYENLLRAFNLFKSAVESFDSLSVLEKEGLIQRFEYTLELSWKTIKDYLESQEVIANFPKEVVKAAFHYEIIDDGDVWMDKLLYYNILTKNNLRCCSTIISLIIFEAKGYIASNRTNDLRGY